MYSVLKSFSEGPQKGRAPVPCGGRTLKRFQDGPDDVVIMTALYMTAINKSRSLL